MVQTDQNDTMYAGNKRTLRFTVLDEDNNDAPLDLTPFTIKWAMSKVNQEGQFLLTPVLEKILGSGITITGPDDNIAVVELLGADTDTLNAADYYMELELFDGSNESVVVATGTMTIIANVENTL
jgi:hypothetical protein